MRGMEQEAKTYQTKVKHQDASPCHGSRALLRSSNGKQCYHRSKPKFSAASPGYGNSVLPKSAKRQQSFPRLKSRSSQLSKQLRRKESPVK